MQQRSLGRVARVSAGTMAPDFTLQHTPSTQMSLRSLYGRCVVLAFYPPDWEPVSREQLMLYQSYASEFARLGACILGISVDHVWSHTAFAHDARILFPLLADFQPRGALARAYGVYRARQGGSARALFVLNSSVGLHFGQRYPDLLNPDVDGILTALEDLARQGDTEASKGT